MVSLPESVLDLMRGRRSSASDLRRCRSSLFASLFLSLSCFLSASFSAFRSFASSFSLYAMRAARIEAARDSGFTGASRPRMKLKALSVDGRDDVEVHVSMDATVDLRGRPVGVLLCRLVCEWLPRRVIEPDEGICRGGRGGSELGADEDGDLERRFASKVRERYIMSSPIRISSASPPSSPARLEAEHDLDIGGVYGLGVCRIGCTYAAVGCRSPPEPVEN